MARNVDDLEWSSRSMTGLVMEHSDRGGEPLLPIPWRNVELPAKLSVGWFTEFGGVRVSQKGCLSVDDRQVQLAEEQSR